MSSLVQQLFAWLILLMLFVFLIIRSRYPKIPVWSFMSFLAFLAVISGLVKIEEIPTAIDFNVIFFLIGMFSIVALAESSGLLDLMSYHVIAKVKNVYQLIFVMSIFLGLLAAIAVNDTVAVMSPPIIYSIAKIARLDLRPMLVLLAFSITIGSVTTPMGNPQNVLIAMSSGVKAPFIYFVKYLLIPTIINLLIASYIVIKFYGIKNRPIQIGLIPEESLKNKKDAMLAIIGLSAAVIAMLLNDVFRLLGGPYIEQTGFIPFLISSSIYFFVSEPRKLIKEVDWGTIIFFITMFIAMDGVWKSGVASDILSLLMPNAIHGVEALFILSIVSIILSQLFSNVPFVKLFIEYLKYLGYTGEDIKVWVTLAMSSTIAGNLTLFGAASNIIILEIAESKYKETIPFTEFLKIGAPLTIINLLVYLFFINLPIPQL